MELSPAERRLVPGLDDRLQSRAIRSPRGSRVTKCRVFDRDVSFKDTERDGWVESSASGTYHFGEVLWTREYVDLYDASGGLTARLYDDAMYMLSGDDF